MLTFLIIVTVLGFLIPVGVGIFTREWSGVGIGIFLGFVLAFFLSILPISYAASHVNEHTATCTVTDKDRGGDEGSYRVYTEECGQLANEDSVWRGKYDSADVWQDIEPGTVCELHIVGFRAPFLSQFPNILDASCS